MIPISELRHLPAALYRKVYRRITGRVNETPWWPMSVIPVIAAHLHEKSVVIEFGSGGSTLWLARRAKHVVAVEHDMEWHLKVQSRLKELDITNVQLILEGGTAYSNPDSLPEPQSYDLAVIDGQYRWQCVEFALSRVKAGGAIYLDNSDADKDKDLYPHSDMHHCAQSLLEKFAATHKGARLRRFVSILNGEIHAGEGMLLEMGRMP